MVVNVFIIDVQLRGNSQVGARKPGNDPDDKDEMGRKLLRTLPRGSNAGVSARLNGSE